MTKHNEIRKSNLTDYTREQAKAKGLTFYKAWKSYQIRQALKHYQEEKEEL